MKKILLAMLLSFGVSQASASGDKFGVGVVFNGGVSLAVQYDKYKAEVGAGSIAVDYLMFVGEIDAVKGLSYYAAPGAYVGFLPTVGIRAAFGLDYNINKQVDVFAEIVPAFNIVGGLAFSTGGAFGARYFF